MWLLHSIKQIWIGFGKFLNKLTSPIIIGLTYFFILTPFALIYQIKKKINPKNEKTTFKNINVKYSKQYFQKLW